MSMNRPHHWLSFDDLEERLALSTAPTATVLPAGNTITVLNEFATAYLSKVGEPNYNPAFDLNHNGQIGQTDAKLLLRALPAVAPRVPLFVNLALAPQDRPKGPVPQNSGGDTHSQTPTIIGRTVPGALIFTGTGPTDLKLAGPVLVANAEGYFSDTVTLINGINQEDFQVVDRYGQQLLREYPIYWLNYGAYEAAHPRND